MSDKVINYLFDHEDFRLTAINPFNSLNFLIIVLSNKPEKKKIMEQ